MTINNTLFKVAIPFLLALSSSIILALIFNEIVAYYNIETGFDSKSSDASMGVKFFTMVLLFPFMETLVFQHFPAKVNEYFTDRKFVLIIVSALLFGLQHFYSWIYIVYGFCLGIIFILFYLQMKKLAVTPLIMTFLLHGTHNGIGFVIFEIL